MFLRKIDCLPFAFFSQKRELFFLNSLRRLYVLWGCNNVTIQFIVKHLVQITRVGCLPLNFKPLAFYCNVLNDLAVNYIGTL